MNADGTMSRFEDLQKFAKEHDLKMISIEELIKYRKAHDELMKIECRAKMPTAYGTFEIVGFDNKLDGKEHIALVKGDVTEKKMFL